MPLENNISSEVQPPTSPSDQQFLFPVTPEEFEGIDLTQTDHDLLDGATVLQSVRTPVSNYLLDGDAGSTLSTPPTTTHPRANRLRLGRRNHPGNAGNSAATTSGASEPRPSVSPPGSPVSELPITKKPYVRQQVVEQKSCGTETLESAVQPDGGDTTREDRPCETGSAEPEARSLEPEVQSAREGVASHPLTANERERLESFYLLYEIADFIKKPDDRETLQRLDALCEIAEFRRKKS
ncbi:uncharacterized protein LOC109143113 isoform X2 [Larimichthys crocea]|uniref:uncharacterized protein LOC109143113 isoform X2 n=1 Tax=Larimichthys crocea TaxID=215358 RepID=UPI000F5FD98C|nr:uncharacterized protein LOC109143113 isoform X2 [Larimichthys crocea]